MKKWIAMGLAETKHHYTLSSFIEKYKVLIFILGLFLLMFFEYFFQIVNSELILGFITGYIAFVLIPKIGS